MHELQAWSGEKSFLASLHLLWIKFCMPSLAVALGFHLITLVSLHKFLLCSTLLLGHMSSLDFYHASVPALQSSILSTLEILGSL